MFIDTGGSLCFFGLLIVFRGFFCVWGGDKGNECYCCGSFMSSKEFFLTKLFPFFEVFRWRSSPINALQMFPQKVSQLNEIVLHCSAPIKVVQSIFIQFPQTIERWTIFSFDHSFDFQFKFHLYYPQTRMDVFSNKTFNRKLFSSWTLSRNVVCSITNKRMAQRKTSRNNRSVLFNE